MLSSELCYRLLCLLYKMILREIIYGIVIDTKSKFDDNLLIVCDKLFQYNREIKEDQFADAMGNITKERC